MLFNFLDQKTRRVISTCNYNQHIDTVHPDRVMEEHDLIYIRDGNWSISQDKIDYVLHPGDVILLQGGHHHYGTVPCAGTVNTCFVHFNSVPRDKVSTKEGQETDCYSFPIVVSCKGKPMIERCFYKIIQAYWSDDRYARQKASAWLELCLCELGEQETADAGNGMAEEIKRLIKMTPERFISNAEFAEKYCCCIRTVTTKFKESTGCSLHAWQMRMKCQMAKELLESDPSLTLKEVASVYGFYDEYHFSKSYKKIFGSSPGKRKER